MGNKESKSLDKKAISSETERLREQNEQLNRILDKVREGVNSTGTVSVPAYKENWTSQFTVQKEDGSVEIRNNLLVSGIPLNVAQQEIENLFKNFDGFLRVEMKKSDPQNAGKFRQTALVFFNKPETATNALRAMDGHDYKKSNLTVAYQVKNKTVSKESSSNSIDKPYKPKSPKTTPLSSPTQPTVSPLFFCPDPPTYKQAISDNSHATRNYLGNGNETPILTTSSTPQTPHNLNDNIEAKSTLAIKNKIWIGNIPLTWTDTELFDKFSNFGKVKCATILPRNPKHNGLAGIVIFEKDYEALRAIDKMNGTTIGALKLIVKLKN